MGVIFLGIVLIVTSFLLKGMRQQGFSSEKINSASWLVLVVGILLAIGGVLASSIVQVPAGHVAVLLQFRAVKGQLDEGIHFIIPGIQSTDLMEVRTQKEETVASAASKDLQIITANLALNFRVDKSKVAELYRDVGLEYKARIIDPKVQESIKVVTSQYTAEELIRKRAEVKTTVETDLADRLKEFHVIVDPNGLSITNFDFSAEFNKAIESKQVAQQEAERQKYLLDRAELQKQTDIARAQGKAEAAKLNAEALKVQGGALVIAREWIEKWDGKLPHVSAGGGESGGNFIIDISSLMRASGN